jgi:CO dehydrogenase/acetyl-CoA synthase alpha subunit
MLSQSPGIYILLGSILSAILSSVISGIMLLAGNYYNNKSQLKREEKQHIWQLEREQQQRIWQEKSEQQKWNREKIYDSYEKLIHLLTKTMQTKVKIVHTDFNMLSIDESFKLSDLHNEFIAELAKIIVDHPDKNSEEFNKIIDEVTQRNPQTFLKEDEFLTQVKIIRIREKDSRVKGISNI